ncbi:hypothetical protein BaRGS_00029465 [Batillaria attramentaria]|uniref:YitH/HolE acetyltransferase (GNAT) domain-containing protein n=1 Tax=Batillaria attramentaria TaxID=370345 RepID=A0ABD0JXC4_9CAEN
MPGEDQVKSQKQHRLTLRHNSGSVRLKLDSAPRNSCTAHAKTQGTRRVLLFCGRRHPILRASWVPDATLPSPRSRLLSRPPRLRLGSCLPGKFWSSHPETSSSPSCAVTTPACTALSAKDYLRNWIVGCQNVSFVAVDADSGNVVGYVALSLANGRWDLNPLYADSDEVATQLLKRAAEQVGEPIRLFVRIPCRLLLRHQALRQDAGHSA